MESMLGLIRELVLCPAKPSRAFLIFKKKYGIIFVENKKGENIMSVITIFEENHGIIGAAKDYKSAIKFLVKENWLDENTEIWDYIHRQSKLLKDVLGENVIDVITEEWDIRNFNDFFDGSFLLQSVSVYGGE